MYSFQKLDVIAGKLRILRTWSPTGKARGTSIKIPSYAEASEGYPPVAKSTEASSFEYMNSLATLLRIHPRAEPVVFCVGG